MRPEVSACVFYLDDDTILYPSGHYMVVATISTGAQQFLPGSPEHAGITAACMSRSRKYLAVAEYHDKAAIVIYDLDSLKRRRMLVASEVGSREYVSLSFSPDERYLAGMGGSPEWNVVLFLWEKGRVVHHVRVSSPQQPIAALAFAPDMAEDTSGRITVVGASTLKALSVVAGQLEEVEMKAQGRSADCGFSCQCYIPLKDPPAFPAPGEDPNEAPPPGEGLQVVGTQAGEILILRDGDVKQLLARSDGPGSISAVCPHPAVLGFAAGGSNGFVCFVERVAGDGTEELPTFTILKQTKLPRDDGTVVGMAVSPSGTSMTVTTSSSRVYIAQLGENGLPTPSGPDGDEFSLLVGAFHSAPITGLSTCIRRPIVATCSLNGQTRIWNYETNVCELSRDFVEEAHSIALHPSGYLVAVGFADKLRLMTIMMDDLRVIKEFNIKGCRECKFSNGGQYLAAVNGSTISILATYTGETVNGLRGHNGKVNAVLWSDLDDRLMTTGGDGAIYVWRMEDFQRNKESESVLKGCTYRSLAADAKLNRIYAVGSDHLLKEVDERGTFVQEIRCSDHLTQVVLPVGARSMFVSTDVGTIRAYKYPLNGEFQEPEMKPHYGKITRMTLRSVSD